MTTKRTLPDPRIEEARQRWLRGSPDEAPASGRYVAYWMQRTQRAEDNHALEAAIHLANEMGVGVLAVFGLMDDYPEANLRHYRFMADGLRDAAEQLAERGIPLRVRHAHPADAALEAARHARVLVCDRGYLKHERAWRERVAREASCPVLEVETDVVVPVEIASDKREYAARTLRPKIHRHFDAFCVLPEPLALAHPLERAPGRAGLDVSDPVAVCRKLKLDRSVGAVDRHFTGGAREARRRLTDFLRESLEVYAPYRSQPHTDHTTHLSAYLHFGQISPVRIVVEALDALRKKGRRGGGRPKAGDPRRESVESLIEELVVRRELSHNYVTFEPRYDQYAALPEWAQKTLAAHASDPRPGLVDLATLESASTEDPYWNAAMQEMLATGYMHNYMRMYWGKKILEWSPTPEQAFEWTLALNNRYFLDGRDAASFANVAWIFGLHDRPWQERPIYGTVRCMMASGLERKCRIDDYVDKVSALT